MQEPSQSDSDRLLTQRDVADRLGVSVSWVRQETRAGRLGSVTLGAAGRRLVRYTPDALAAFITDREQPAAAAPNPYGRRRRGSAA